MALRELRSLVQGQALISPAPGSVQTSQPAAHGSPRQLGRFAADGARMVWAAPMSITSGTGRSVVHDRTRAVVNDLCPLCGSASWSVLVDGGPAGFEWVRCPCGLVFKQSEPATAAATGAEALGDADTAHYDEQYFGRYARRRRRRIRKSRRQILDALDALGALEVAPPGRLLDVGCSLGYALEAARGLGLEAAGVDLAGHAVAECRRAGFDARTGTLGALPFEDASFAVAVLKHVFEHTPAPREALRELRRVLVPGAAVFFAVPNLRYFKAVRDPATSRFFRGEAGRAHHVYYTPQTLSRLLEDEGFRVAAVHPRLVHRRASLLSRALEVAALPLRVPLRLFADAFGLRKEFWLVAVRT